MGGGLSLVTPSWDITNMVKKSATDQASAVLAVGKESILVQRVIEGVMSSARKLDPAVIRQDISAGADSAAGDLANAL